jgi:hypothetical protein
MSRVRRLAAGVALVVAGVTIPVGVASAGPGGTKGPGDCGFGPGFGVVRHNIDDHGRPLGGKFGGVGPVLHFPNAGPNSQEEWADPPAPNAPGQAVKEDC